MKNKSCLFIKANVRKKLLREKIIGKINPSLYSIFYKYCGRS